MIIKEKDKKASLLLKDLLILEDYIHDLFSFSPLPICFVSPLGVILEANPAFAKISNLKIEEIIGSPVENFFQGKQGKKLTKGTLEKERIKGKELIFLQNKKKKLFTHVFTKARKDEKEETVGYFLGLFDITKIKKTEEELKESKASLEIKVEARTKALEEERKNLEQKVEQRTAELQEKIDDLERFQKLTVGRELKMIELKKEIENLTEKIK